MQSAIQSSQKPNYHISGSSVHKLLLVLQFNCAFQTPTSLPLPPFEADKSLWFEYIDHMASTSASHTTIILRTTLVVSLWYYERDGRYHVSVVYGQITTRFGIKTKLCVYIWPLFAQNLYILVLNINGINRRSPRKYIAIFNLMEGTLIIVQHWISRLVSFSQISEVNTLCNTHGPNA